MPTGYTMAVEDGNATFASFIWKCASAFFAEGEIHVDQDRELLFHEKEVKKATETVRVFKERSMDAWRRDYDRETERLRAFEKEIVVSYQAKVDRYNKMIEEVTAWKLPSDNHTKLKAFALEQLKDSREFCTPSDYGYLARHLETSLDDYIAAEETKALADLAYAERKLGEYRGRLAERMKWLRDLEKSVPRPKEIR